ncbi:MAG: NADH-quinone oxidoreductase subunit C [Coriobacteriia bacterium]|nr:NADH-quinone oxidoreductase subunit C [Coriobacteriia bacterium]
MPAVNAPVTSPLKLDAIGLRGILASAGASFISCVDEGKLGTVIRVHATERDTVIAALRDGETAFTQMIDLFGADLEACEAVEADEEKGIEAQPAQPGCVEVTYFLRSMKYDYDVRVKMQLAYQADYHSVIDFFLSALLSERELCEMFGLTLLDHPNPKRLVTNKNYPTPLLKTTPIRSKEVVWTRS